MSAQYYARKTFYDLTVIKTLEIEIEIEIELINNNKGTKSRARVRQGVGAQRVLGG